MSTTWTLKILGVAVSNSIIPRATFIRPLRHSRLEYNIFRQQIPCVRLLSYTASCWKASEPEVLAPVTDVDKMNRITKDNQKPQKRVERLRPSSTRTPWLESGRKLMIWEGYNRNHKGSIPPVKTRARCKRGKDNICGNPCPICRNNIYVHFRNTSLLEQFICHHTGQILEATRTGLCRQQQKRIVTAIEKAWDYGLMSFTVSRQLSEESLGIPPWNKLDIK